MFVDWATACVTGVTWLWFTPCCWRWGLISWNWSGWTGGERACCCAAAAACCCDGFVKGGGKLRKGSGGKCCTVSILSGWVGAAINSLPLVCVWRCNALATQRIRCANRLRWWLTEGKFNTHLRNWWRHVIADESIKLSEQWGCRLQLSMSS